MKEEEHKPTLVTLASWEGLNLTNLALEANLDPVHTWEDVRWKNPHVLYRLLQALNKLKMTNYSLKDIAR